MWSGFNPKFSLNRHLISFHGMLAPSKFCSRHFFKLCHWLNFFLASGDLSSAGNLCKQFVPGTKQFVPGTKLFDTLIVFLKEFLEKDLKKVGRLNKKSWNLPSMQWIQKSFKLSIRNIFEIPSAEVLRMYSLNMYKSKYKARIFLLVDLRELFFRFRVKGTKKKINKKALKMTS